MNLKKNDDASERPLDLIVSHPFGRLLTPDEVLRCIAATDDHMCSACGEEWTMHRIRCEGSEVANEKLRGAP